MLRRLPSFEHGNIDENLCFSMEKKRRNTRRAAQRKLVSGELEAAPEETQAVGHTHTNMSS